MSSDFEKMLLDTDLTVKKTVGALLNNIGKTIAIITLTVATLVTFTDISFGQFGSESFTGTLMIMTVCATVLYFSLEDAGERLGMQENEYKRAKNDYEAAKEKIKADNLESFKEYLNEIALSTRGSQQSEMLLEHGLSQSDLDSYLRGENPDKKRAAILKKISRIKVKSINVMDILSSAHQKHTEGFKNPKGRHFVNLCLKILPSLLCMTVTVSIMLTTKEDMSAASVISGVMKLSTLPIIGLRGYIAGYNFAKDELSAYLESKKRIIEGFILSTKQ